MQRGSTIKSDDVLILLICHTLLCLIVEEVNPEKIDKRGRGLKIKCYLGVYANLKIFENWKF